MTQTNWTAKVTGWDNEMFPPPRTRPRAGLTPDSVPQVVLFHAGLTSLIAHIRVGRMQVALEAKSTVQPAVGEQRNE